MKTIVEKKVTDIIVFAVVVAKDWFSEHKITTLVYANDFVVCTWSNFHDGEKSNIEGKTTIAICRKLKDAMLIFNNKIKDVEPTKGIVNHCEECSKALESGTVFCSDDCSRHYYDVI